MITVKTIQCSVCGAQETLRISLEEIHLLPCNACGSKPNLVTGHVPMKLKELLVGGCLGDSKMRHQNYGGFYPGGCH